MSTPEERANNLYRFAISQARLTYAVFRDCADWLPCPHCARKLFGMCRHNPEEQQ